jgi:hypothetical protein
MRCRALPFALLAASLVACSSGSGGPAATTASSSTTTGAGGGDVATGVAGATSSGAGGAVGDAGVPDAAPPPPESVCGADDQPITSVSTTWGPAWAKPDPSKIINGWPLERRYELWWIPLPVSVAGILAYRIEVPPDYDATVDPDPNGQVGYVRTAESPSTGVAAYEYALSETACDFKHAVPIQSDAAPYGPSANVAYSAQDNAPSVNIQVRPKGMTHCVPIPGGGTYAACLEPGHTYWWNLRVVPGGCNANPTDNSACQPMIHVQRVKQTVDPNY